MIKSLVLKDFRDIEEDKIFKKNGVHFTKTLKRAEALVEKGFIKILEIEKQSPTNVVDYSKKSLKELRELYPDIKAKTKKAFLEQI